MRYKSKPIVIVIVLTILFSSTYSIYTYEKFEKNFEQLEEQNIHYGKIISFEKETQYMYKYKCSIDNKVIYLYANKNEKYSYGDILQCIIKFDKPSGSTNLGGFNYKLFLYSNGICAAGYVEKVLSVQKATTGIMEKINECKYELCNRIDKKFNEQTSNVIKTMLLNDDSTIDSETKNIFYNIGVAHVLVPSSTHLMYILVFVAYLGCILNIKGKGKQIFTVIVMGIYLVITNFSISIIRVFFMYVLSLITFLKNNDVTYIQKLSFVLLLVLLSNPLMIYNIGLLLSFVSSLGIMLLSDRIKYRLEYGINRENKSVMLKRIIEMISITIGVQIAILPILVNCFNSIYITSIFANILIVPLSGLLVILSIIFALVYNIGILSDCFVVILNIIVQSIIYISKIFNILPLSKILVFPLSTLEVLLYYACIYTIFFSKKYYIILKEIIRKVLSYIQRANRKLVIAFAIIIIIVIIVLKYMHYTQLSIEFIDVGQGDCTLIKTYGKSILIDGGGGNSIDFDVGERTVLPYLLYRKTKRIDYVFVSHFDNDHYGGLKAIIENLSVKNVVIGKQKEVTKEFIEFMTLVKKKKINVIVVEKNNILRINDMVSIHILLPDNIFEASNINNASIVMKFTYFNFTMLFTGDIEKEAENYMIKHRFDIKADVLKIAHHGSKSSSTQELLECVNPSIGIIGVGKNNSFGHPHSEVIDRLKNMNISVYMTKNDGEIIIQKLWYSKCRVKTVCK